ncbi:hypothetical protein ZIOFF_003190 [Zingiber officinale]|uniref:Transposase n=1 Tax=Zingiber officinale TaxID=94328 RepID=A0A8J5HY07_ZINOF|nr:hypothetical protein ZIOFF_003190 [Zingiber officinale]
MNIKECFMHFKKLCYAIACYVYTCVVIYLYFCYYDYICHVFVIVPILIAVSLMFLCRQYSMGRKKQVVAVEEIHGVVDAELHGVADTEVHEGTDREECSVDVQKNKRGPTSMCKLTAAARWGKKAKIDYDDMGRPLYNANGKALQSYIGCVARTMVPINIKSWPTVPENIKQKLWEEISNVFELTPQSETAVMNSASQKWRDFKNKLTSRFVWPNKDNPEKLSSPPSQYQIPKAVWKAFVDERLHPSWERGEEEGLAACLAYVSDVRGRQCGGEEEEEDIEATVTTMCMRWWKRHHFHETVMV